MIDHCHANHPRSWQQAYAPGDHEDDDEIHSTPEVTIEVILESMRLTNTDEQWKRETSSQIMRARKRRHLQDVPPHGLFLMHCIENETKQSMVVEVENDNTYALIDGELRVTIHRDNIEATRASLDGQATPLNKVKLEIACDAIEKLKTNVDHGLVKYLTEKVNKHETNVDKMKTDQHILFKHVVRIEEKLQLESDAHEFEKICISAMYQGAIDVGEAFILRARYEAIKDEDGNYPNRKAPKFYSNHKKNLAKEEPYRQTIKNATSIVLNVLEPQHVKQDQRIEVSEQLSTFVKSIAADFGGSDKLIEAMGYIDSLKKERGNAVHGNAHRDFMDILDGKLDTDKYRQAFSELMERGAKQGYRSAQQNKEKLEKFERMMEISSKLHKYLMFKEPKPQDNKEN
mmetsp:Transcript_530/g.1332  ORF Transcript_530/g.1332 Transcript_530/m.1332 type:complete len:401 (-) Transcript_530:51-1253(-)|eukprot:CAMPEP_0171485120 /NCGR_PEP_ID=MMETSP0958-20121227/371_1 /TAXON_ID=87120 /ORGANISM="Aurantiochytrium limacinum, Strain ATCCMYA-1381" /LENGTH=400 /DNA_ID=CAMNT_0012017879 /DNA_START=24 /DNA_END=1226 /DNA_ORIENTATION=+